MVGEEEEALIIKDFDHFTVAGLYKRIAYIYLKREPKKRAGYDKERVKGIGTQDIPSSYPQNRSVGRFDCRLCQSGWGPSSCGRKGTESQVYLLAFLLAQLVSRA